MLNDYFEVNVKLFALEQCLVQKAYLSVNFYLYVF